MMKTPLTDAEIEEALERGRGFLTDAPGAALEQAQLILEAAPEPRALRLAAAAHRSLGSDAEAEQAELAAISASLEHSQLNRAIAAAQQGQSDAARVIAEDFLRQHPDDLLALAIAAESAINSGDFEAGEAKLREVRARAPGFLRASMLLARCLATQMRVREAISVIEDAARREPQNLAILRYLASLNADVGNHSVTAELYEQILKAPDAQADDWISYGQYLRISGRSGESLAAFRRALAIAPTKAGAWWALAHFFPDDVGDADVDRIRRRLAEGVSRRDAAQLHLALSMAADLREDHEEAFRHLSAAAKLRPQPKPHDPEALGAELDRVSHDLVPPLVAARASAESKDNCPIFIVGMPRSGSTLVERILGRHSMIEGAGELRVMPRLVEQLSRRARPETYSKLVAPMADEELTALGQAYISGFRDFRRTDKPMFIDKLNTNWLNIGLIRLILPNAKILDVRRDALDCCWSNFKMQLGDAYCGDLRHVGRHYLDYVRFVDRIHEAAPGAILRVRYEDIVNDIEKATRRTLDFLGLDFEPDCISFHLSDEPVATPSSEQVRRPLHRGGIGAADAYRRWLGPLIEELGPLARRA